METAAFDTLAAARELEAAGMDRPLAEVTALNMHKAGTAHLDQPATSADLERHQLANETAFAQLKVDMLKVAVGIMITNAGFVLAGVKFPS